jgi:hypothetical protein
MRRPLLAAGLLIMGCTYYNGMYNAKSLAASAERAEHQGRTIEANQYWNLVATKAESVLIRHPKSKWADEARVLRGTALARVHDCAHAIAPLEQVMLEGRDEQLRDDAAATLGECRLAQNDTRGAMVAFQRLLDSKNSEQRTRARLEYGRALRLDGQLEEALARLEATSDPRAPGERAAVLAGLGRATEALSLADSLVARKDTTAPWGAILDGIARNDPERASGLVDSLEALDLSADFKAGLLLEDGRRWMERDTLKGQQRLGEAEAAGEGRSTAGLARLTLAKARLAFVDTTAALQEQEQALIAIANEPGPYAPIAGLLAAVALRTRLAADSAIPGRELADLRAFVAGEMARDSLGAPRLAARLFQRVAREWPDSPFAPKALLALLALQPEGADSLRDLLLTRYPGSPYLEMLEGRESPAYVALEDSLREFLAAFRPEGRPVARPVPAPSGQQPRRPLE